MSTTFGSAANNTWTLIAPGTLTLDGLGGTDTLSLGTSLRSEYTVTQATDGSVHVDSISGASSALHATLYNMEVLVFNSNRDTLDLTTYFDKTAPSLSTVSPANQASNAAVGSDIVIGFSEAIQKGSGSISIRNAAGSTVASLDVASSSAVTVSGSTLTINPSSDLAYETSFTVIIPAGSVKDLAGNAYAGSTAYGFTTAANTALQSVTGTTGNDTFSALSGHTLIDGLAGTDTLALGLSSSAYLLSQSSSGFMLTGTSTTDIYELSHVERLAFTNLNVALDLGATQSAGETQLLLGAVLGRNLLATKSSLTGAVIGLFDQGYSMQTLSGALMRLDIWGTLAGGTSNSHIANYLLTTVNQTAPDATTLAAAVAALDAQTGAAQGNFLWELAASSANQTQVGLVGLAATGLEYLV